MGNCPKCDDFTSIIIKYENNEIIILNEVEGQMREYQLIILK